MSKLKEISDELILIAYADVQDRNSLLSDLSFKLANNPKSELSDNERVLLMEIIDGFMVDVFLTKKEKDKIFTELIPNYSYRVPHYNRIFI